MIAVFHLRCFVARHHDPTLIFSWVSHAAYFVANALIFEMFDLSTLATIHRSVSVF